MKRCFAQYTSVTSLLHVHVYLKYSFLSVSVRRKDTVDLRETRCNEITRNRYVRPFVGPRWLVIKFVARDRKLLVNCLFVSLFDRQAFDKFHDRPSQPLKILRFLLLNVYQVENGRLEGDRVTRFSRR